MSDKVILCSKIYAFVQIWLGYPWIFLCWEPLGVGTCVNTVFIPFYSRVTHKRYKKIRIASFYRIYLICHSIPPEYLYLSPLSLHPKSVSHLSLFIPNISRSFVSLYPEFISPLSLSILNLSHYLILYLKSHSFTLSFICLSILISLSFVTHLINLSIQCVYL